MNLFEKFENIVNNDTDINTVLKLRNSDEELYDWICSAIVVYLRSSKLKYYQAFEMSVLSAMIIINNFETPDPETFLEEERKVVKRFLSTLYLKSNDEGRKDMILDMILEMEKLYV